jgi:hypothetical protein
MNREAIRWGIVLGLTMMALRHLLDQSWPSLIVIMLAIGLCIIWALRGSRKITRKTGDNR